MYNYLTGLAVRHSASLLQVCDPSNVPPYVRIADHASLAEDLWQYNTTEHRSLLSAIFTPDEHASYRLAIWPARTEAVPARTDIRCRLHQRQFYPRRSDPIRELMGNQGSINALPGF